MEDLMLCDNSNTPKCIIDCIKMMLVRTRIGMPFYGEFNLYINFKESKDIDTMGVYVNKDGMNCVYSKEFIEKLTPKELAFILLHEDFHLLLHHNMRASKGLYNHDLANISMDSIINTLLIRDISDDFIEPLKEKGKNAVLLIDKDYDGLMTFESYYVYLYEKYQQYKEKHKNDESKDSSVDNKKDGTGSGSSKNDSKNQKDGSKKKSGNSKEGDTQEDDPSKDPSKYGKYVKDPKNLDKTTDGYSLDHIFERMEAGETNYLDVHMEDDVSEEMKEQMIDSCINALRNRGLITSNISETLKELRKKHTNYLAYIKRSISTDLIGTIKHKTIIRPNRHNIAGMKGNKKYSCNINCILDTSGSMSGLFEKVLSYLYKTDIAVNMIECDTEVKSVKKINTNKQLSNMKIDGLGGTVLQPSIDLVAKEYNKYNTLILTDGYCDDIDLSEIDGRVLIITCGVEVPIKRTNNRVRQIIAKEEN